MSLLIEGGGILTSVEKRCDGATEANPREALWACTLAGLQGWLSYLHGRAPPGTFIHEDSGHIGRLLAGKISG